MTEGDLRVSCAALALDEILARLLALIFAHGAMQDDPDKLFNAGLKGGTRRAIDIFEGENVDAGTFILLVRQAVAFNVTRRDLRKQ